MAFPPNNRNFDVKVNRKARKAALRSALSAHAQGGTLGVLDPAAFDAPSTKAALELVGAWGKELPLLVVAQPEEEALIKSFRNLAARRRSRFRPSSRCSTSSAPARCSISERALELVQGRAPVSLHPNQVLLAPVVSEKSYELIEQRKYAFRVHPDAHKTQVRQAVEELFGVKVQAVNMLKVQAKPKRRGMIRGEKPGWKKAIVQLREGETIEIFEGAQA